MYLELLSRQLSLWFTPPTYLRVVDIVGVVVVLVVVVVVHDVVGEVVALAKSGLLILLGNF